MGAKVIVLGDPGVGKTSLFKLFCESVYPITKIPRPSSSLGSPLSLSRLVQESGEKGVKWGENGAGDQWDCVKSYKTRLAEFDENSEKHLRKNGLINNNLEQNNSSKLDKNIEKLDKNGEKLDKNIEKFDGGLALNPTLNCGGQRCVDKSYVLNTSQDSPQSGSPPFFEGVHTLSKLQGRQSIAPTYGCQIFLSIIRGSSSGAKNGTYQDSNPGVPHSWTPLNTISPQNWITSANPYKTQTKSTISHPERHIFETQDPCPGNISRIDNSTHNYPNYPPPNFQHNIQDLLVTEFWDIGTSQAQLAARSVFYQQIDGICLVYDITNSNSYRNLSTWLLELFTRQAVPSKTLFPDSDSEDIEAGQSHHSEICERILSGDIPIICIGNKIDLAVPSHLPLSKIWAFLSHLPSPPSAFLPPHTFLDILFGGMRVFLNKLWQRRLKPAQLEHLKRMAVKIMSRTETVYASALTLLMDVSTMDHFLARVHDNYQSKFAGPI